MASTGAGNPTIPAPSGNDTPGGHEQNPTSGVVNNPTYSVALAPSAANNSNYRGVVHENVGIAEHENTCLWITNLPPNCSAHDILSKIRNVGKVYHLSINPPTGRMNTSAAKLDFWNQYDTDRMLGLVSRGGFRFNGVTPTVRMNRHMEPPGPATDESRVVHISGPSAIVNQQTLDRIFYHNFFWTIDEVIPHFNDGHTAWIEYRFASYHNQASNA
ncbi:hypothetical protein F4818DRAFT_457384 [Hypoxylon cercidicola]|nr:hypothetical protein F4818DRAFT_457384 [Hypoxylon cercidicola]